MSSPSSSNFQQSYEVLYTTHKTQKRKKWHDGLLKVNKNASILQLLCPNTGRILLSANNSNNNNNESIMRMTKQQLQSLLRGMLQEFEMDQFLVQIVGPASPTTTAAPSQGMQKLLQRKFEKPPRRRQQQHPNNHTTVILHRKRPPPQPNSAKNKVQIIYKENECTGGNSTSSTISSSSNSFLPHDQPRQPPPPPEAIRSATTGGSASPRDPQPSSRMLSSMVHNHDMFVQHDAFQPHDYFEEEDGNNNKNGNPGSWTVVPEPTKRTTQQDSASPTDLPQPFAMTSRHDTTPNRAAITTDSLLDLFGFEMSHPQEQETTTTEEENPSTGQNSNDLCIDPSAFRDTPTESFVLPAPEDESSSEDEG